MKEEDIGFVTLASGGGGGGGGISDPHLFAFPSPTFFSLPSSSSLSPPPPPPSLFFFFFFFFTNWHAVFDCVCLNNQFCFNYRGSHNVHELKMY